MKKKCMVDDCDRDAMYKKACLCQKHYFRMMRYGTTSLTRHGVKKDKTKNKEGYVMIYDPSHPLAMKNGRVYEHRAVVFNLIGMSLESCDICGKHVSWGNVHIDHIDMVVDNNSPSNLRPLCPSCNTARSKTLTPRHCHSGNHPITHNGLTMTAAEWARMDGVNVSGKTIRLRFKSGMSAEESIFGKKLTHKHKKAKVVKNKYGDSWNDYVEIRRGEFYKLKQN